MRAVLVSILFSVVAGPGVEPVPVIAAKAAVSSRLREIPAATVRSDFAVLYSTLQEAHFDLYAHRSKLEYDGFYRELAATIRGPMDATVVATLFQRFVAYGRIGHARVDAPITAFVAYLQRGGTMLPIFIRVDGRRVLLTQAAEETGVLRPGVEITAIDGVPIDEVVKRLGGYVSAERPYMAAAQMEQSFPALLWLDRGPLSSVAVTATVADQSKTVLVRAVTRTQRQILAAKFPSSAPPDLSGRALRFLGEGVAYLRPGPFFDIDQGGSGPEPSYKAAAFLNFIDDSFGKIIASGASDLVIDLRDNPGGDNSFSDPMVAWFADKPFRFASSFMLRSSAATKADYARLRAAGTPIDPEFARQMNVEAQQPNGTRYRYELPIVQPREGGRFKGRVWVLINRHSYSNAASVAALVQDYSFGKVMGEETADVASNFASVQTFNLPSTGITVTYPKSHFIRPNGVDEVSGVKPDIVIERPTVGTSEDTVLNSAAQIIRARRQG